MRLKLLERLEGPVKKLKKNEHHITIIIALILAGLILLPSNASAIDVFVNPVHSPNGAVLVIVDGMGSSYIYPEFMPYDLDGNESGKANLSNIMSISESGTRVLDVRAPQPSTTPGHSVLTTGYSKANEDTVGEMITIFDVIRKHDYVCMAVMQKGDFEEMRAEQDAILFDASHSIREPSIALDYKLSCPNDVVELMQEWQNNSLLGEKEGVERYIAYNEWAIGASDAIASFMCENHPDQKFLLTVNVGAVDLAGHYLGSEQYLYVIEGLDRDIYDLYKTCSENNLILIITADHGMAFDRTEMGREVGGHASEKYAKTLEAQRVPLIINGPNIRKDVISGTYGQEDLAPTLLSGLDVMGVLPCSDGDIIPVKEYANLRVIVDSPTEVVLKGDAAVASASDEDITFLGLLPGNYTILVSSREEYINLNSDQIVELHISRADRRMVIATVMISVVMVVGLLAIWKIMRE
ncbi:MAG: sulfatase-like hydrolase/transferase [Methanocellales archaeon]|nr:sulfatase-like hydrolase/transferase [Methanocellales archaeon]